MQTFTCAYQFAGRTHVVHVEAADDVEASRRLRAIGMTGQVDGVLIADIAIEGREGWLTRLRRLIGGSRNI